VIASSASNTWGLFLLVLLLGHALVEIPRGLWRNSKSGYTLQYTYFRVSKVSEEKCEAELEVDQLLDSLRVNIKTIDSCILLYSVRGLERSELSGSHGCPGRLWDCFLWQVYTPSKASCLLYRSGRPVIKIGPKGTMGSHEIPNSLRSKPRTEYR